MKPLTAAAAALTGILAASPAFPSAELAQKRNCMACHATDKKLVGPSYKDVAAKYAGQPGAAANLAQRIQKGGSGVWGPVPMPANPHVSADEAQLLAVWVLSLK
jgi:cytochrome c